jgi:hypothetical protein
MSERALRIKQNTKERAFVEFSLLPFQKQSEIKHKSINTKRTLFFDCFMLVFVICMSSNEYFHTDMKKGDVTQINFVCGSILMDLCLYVNKKYI